MVSRTNDMMGFYEQKFNDNIHELRCLIEEDIEAIKEYIIDFESSIQHRSDPAHNIHRLNGEIGSQLLSCMGDTNQIWLRNYKKYSQIVCSIQIIIKLLNDTLQILIENCLGNWKRDQIVAGFGDGNIKVPSNLHDRNAQLKSALDDIQQKFEVLFEYALHTRALLNDIHHCHSQLHYVDTLAMEASQETTAILHNLIQSSFIIDEQPPQVINKDKK
ncbi:signal transducer and activator of transcription 5A-like [Sitodiplosis mosellana]|uniref:signal transducer and activator of transcription 5A-like n=1 Tax=Sitodiplosis mosellana TaxID=263140 RepID=UPI00244507D0|nr:signal transducer and activator of transcription 5A-like [Sitodiplosis mosellana]XP_055307334.1 signal transducer and activator of transcription 5A-like [Sitodiplosis mosellana]XP_055307335.1 signal transducer and activator of transcription 5A-like [Sitodiplosis mosellana]